MTRSILILIAFAGLALVAARCSATAWSAPGSMTDFDHADERYRHMLCLFKMDLTAREDCMRDSPRATPHELCWVSIAYTCQEAHALGARAYEEGLLKPDVDRQDFRYEDLVP